MLERLHGLQVRRRLRPRPSGHDASAIHQTKLLLIQAHAKYLHLR